jgi:hypothetical protein
VELFLFLVQGVQMIRMACRPFLFLPALASLSKGVQMKVQAYVPCT